MTPEPRSTTHVVVTTTAGFSLHADWAALRRTASRSGAVVSAVVLDGDRAITAAPAQPAAAAPARPHLPRPTLAPTAAAWSSLLDSLYQAQAAIPAIERTEVHVFGDRAAGEALSRLVRDDPDIVVRVRDGRPDTARRSRAAAVAPPQEPARAAGPVATRTSPAPGAAPVPTPRPATAPAVSVQGPARASRRSARRSFRILGRMLALSLPLWLLTPVVASFGTLVVPGLGTAVFAASENNGATSGDGPITLYVHLALVLAATCVVVLLLNLVLGPADGSFGALPVVGTIAGVVAFFVLVRDGGELWMWDIAPATGVTGYALAQIGTRIRHL